MRNDVFTAAEIGASVGSTRWRRVILALTVLVPALLVSQPMTAQSAAATQPASVQGFAKSSLRPGDALRVRVWREPDLSGEFTVDESGVVTLPKLGPIRVADESVGALKARIVSQYATYITQPVEVTPLLRIRVLGAVRTPGLYKVEPVMTLNDAIALAGGTTEAARADRVNLIRNGRSVDAALSPNAVLAESPLQSGDQLYIPERGWLSRNPGMLFGAISAVATIVWAFRR
jgi:polysaccharide export outer membrane protein